MRPKQKWSNGFSKKWVYPLFLKHWNCCLVFYFWNRGFGILYAQLCYSSIGDVKRNLISQMNIKCCVACSQIVCSCMQSLRSFKFGYGWNETKNILSGFMVSHIHIMWIWTLWTTFSSVFLVLLFSICYISRNNTSTKGKNWQSKFLNPPPPPQASNLEPSKLKFSLPC